MTEEEKEDLISTMAAINVNEFSRFREFYKQPENHSDFIESALTSWVALKIAELQYSVLRLNDQVNLKEDRRPFNLR